MPKINFSLSLPKANLDLFAHWRDNFTDFDIIALSLEYFGHSSKTITISEFNFFWTSILISGDKKTLLPSIWELNVTPSEVTMVFFESDITWNPPESVKIGKLQFINLWSPPTLSILSIPGLKSKW